MNDFIKRADVLKESELMRPVISFNTDAREAVDVGRIIALPVADVEEVRHGHWYATEYEYYSCSVCGESYYNGCESSAEAKHRLKTKDTYKYCPNCGAKMDGKEKEK